MNRMTRLLGCVAAAFAATCSQPARDVDASQTVAIVRQQSFTQCPGGIAEPRTTLFADDKAWREWVRTAANAELADWRPDFASQRIVLVSAGTRPSTGYALRIVRLERAGPPRMLRIQLEESRPPPGMMAAAVITTPCVFAVVRAADVDRVEIAAP